MKNLGFYRYHRHPRRRVRSQVEQVLVAFVDMVEALVKILTLGFFGANWSMRLISWLLMREINGS